MKRYVFSVSNLYINVEGKILNFSFNYKNLIRYDLYWDLDFIEQEGLRKPSLIIWEPEEQAGTIEFTGTEEEYNEYVLPLVQLWEAEKKRQEEDQVLQANLQLEKYDSVISTYQNRIGIALANGDTELVTELQNEMNSYDPAVDTQSVDDINHYCKKCGHDLDAYNICTNENCKRKQMQDNIVQLVEEREAKEASEIQTEEDTEKTIEVTVE